MRRARSKSAAKRKLTPEEREDVGQSARRVMQAIREFQAKAGQTISEDEVCPWSEMNEPDRELFRNAGEAVASGILPSEQDMWDMLPKVRAEMGEKAFRQKMFSICSSITVERIASGLTELERYQAAEAIVGLSGMLDVPPDEDATLAQFAVIMEQLDRIERKENNESGREA